MYEGNLVLRAFFQAREKALGTRLVRESRGAFHYAKLTGQRSVVIPEENGTTFSDYTRPTN